MNQESSLTRKLSQAQVDHAAAKASRHTDTQSILYRIYTEGSDALRDRLRIYTSRYFDGATFTFGVGLYKGETEESATIEIFATARDRQRVFDLAGDIRVVNSQKVIIVTWQLVSRFDITEESINRATF